MLPPLGGFSIELFATAGGMFGPIAVYLGLAAFLGSDTYSAVANGWAIPTATDIAFSYLVGRLVFGAGHPAVRFLLLLAIADELLQGDIAQAGGELDAAIEHFENAVAVQDQLPYMEPPFWYYPTRQSLGKALILAGRVWEAQEALRFGLVSEVAEPQPSHPFFYWGERDDAIQFCETGGLRCVSHVGHWGHTSPGTDHLSWRARAIEPAHRPGRARSRLTAGAWQARIANRRAKTRTCGRR